MKGLQSMNRIITVTSGKGGVGKTNISANLGIQLASQGHRVCLFDADLGLANINVILGLYPEATIDDVILRKKPISEVVIRGFHGIDIVPGSSGVEKIANADPDATRHLVASLAGLTDYDYLLLDTSAGISKNVVSFCLASGEIILVITPEPTSLTDAYALLKILLLNGFQGRVFVVINQCADTAVAKTTYTRFRDVVRTFQTVHMQPLGVVLHDDLIADAVKKQCPFLIEHPNAVASRCIQVLAKNLHSDKQEAFSDISTESFWQRFVHHFTGHLNLTGAADREQTSAPQQTRGEESAAPDTVRESDTAPATAAVPAAGDADMTPAEEGSERGSNLYFRKLLRTLESMTDELRQLRMAVQHGNALPTENRDRDPAPVVLDFEQYRRGQTSDTRQ